jgi:hypothetical protein
MEYSGSKTTIGRSEDGSNISVGEIIMNGPDSFIDQWGYKISKNIKMLFRNLYNNELNERYILATLLHEIGSILEWEDTRKIDRVMSKLDSNLDIINEEIQRQNNKSPQQKRKIITEFTNKVINELNTIRKDILRKNLGYNDIPVMVYSYDIKGDTPKVIDFIRRTLVTIQENKNYDLLIYCFQKIKNRALTLEQNTFQKWNRTILYVGNACNGTNKTMSIVVLCSVKQYEKYKVTKSGKRCTTLGYYKGVYYGKKGSMYVDISRTDRSMSFRILNVNAPFPTSKTRLISKDRQYGMFLSNFVNPFISDDFVCLAVGNFNSRSLINYSNICKSAEDKSTCIKKNIVQASPSQDMFEHAQQQLGFKLVNTTQISTFLDERLRNGDNSRSEEDNSYRLELLLNQKIPGKYKNTLNKLQYGDLLSIYLDDKNVNTKYLHDIKKVDFAPSFPRSKRTGMFDLITNDGNNLILPGYTDRILTNGNDFDDKTQQYFQRYFSQIQKKQQDKLKSHRVNLSTVLNSLNFYVSSQRIRKETKILLMTSYKNYNKVVKSDLSSREKNCIFLVLVDELEKKKLQQEKNKTTDLTYKLQDIYIHNKVYYILNEEQSIKKYLAKMAEKDVRRFHFFNEFYAYQNDYYYKFNLTSKEELPLIYNLFNTDLNKNRMIHQIVNKKQKNNHLVQSFSDINQMKFGMDDKLQEASIVRNDEIFKELGYLVLQNRYVIHFQGLSNISYNILRDFTGSNHLPVYSTFSIVDIGIESKYSKNLKESLKEKAKLNELQLKKAKQIRASISELKDIVKKTNKNLSESQLLDEAARQYKQTLKGDDNKRIEAIEKELFGKTSAEVATTQIRKSKDILPQIEQARIREMQRKMYGETSQQRQTRLEKNFGKNRDFYMNNAYVEQKMGVEPKIMRQKARQKYEEQKEKNRRWKNSTRDWRLSQIQGMSFQEIQTKYYNNNKTKQQEEEEMLQQLTTNELKQFLRSKAKDMRNKATAVYNKELDEREYVITNSDIQNEKKSMQELLKKQPTQTTQNKQPTKKTTSKFSNIKKKIIPNFNDSTKENVVFSAATAATSALNTTIDTFLD